MSVSGLDAQQRYGMNEYLIEFETKIRGLMRKNGTEHVDKTLDDVFSRLCKGILKTRTDDEKYGRMVAHIPWVVCLGYAPMSDLSRLRGARYWDTGCALGDIRTPTT